MKVPGVSARFGTDPFIWNWAMWLVARLVPRRFLQNRSQVGGAKDRQTRALAQWLIQRSVRWLTCKLACVATARVLGRAMRS